MFFLLRMAFWLSVVLVLLPSGGSKQQTASAPASQFGAAEAVSAATSTFSDMRNFCSRQPDACAIGSQAAVAFGQRAQAGAKMVYDMISERAAPRETGSIADKAKPAASARDKSLHNTLTAADLAPPWRGPRRDAHDKGSDKSGT
jgi:uncharacterized protein DUF5330